MPINSRQDNTLACPQCGAENHSFASFCIVCGEPFDERLDEHLDVAALERSSVETAERWRVMNVAEFERLSVAKIVPRPLIRNPKSEIQNRVTRREGFIGLALLLFIVGYVLFDWQRGMGQAAAYREGVAAEQRHDWSRAAVVFERAGNQRDAPNRASRARSQVAERNRLYIKSYEAMDNQDWAAATSYLEAIQVIHPAYANSLNMLARARSHILGIED